MNDCKTYLEAAQQVAATQDPMQVYELEPELFRVFNYHLFGWQVCFTDIDDPDLMILMLCFAEEIVAQGEVPGLAEEHFNA